MPRKRFVSAIAAFVLLWSVVVPLLLIATGALAAASDPRYCGPPARTEDGRIARSREALREFRGLYPCPSTGRHTGVCPGWALDHVIPLSACGCDSVSNLQWLKNSIKSASGPDAKDRWERRVYCVAFLSSPVRDGGGNQFFVKEA